MDVRQQMDALIEQLNAYNEAYYQQNTSLISDQAFDQLLAQLQKLESEYPLFANPNSPTQRVGGTITKTSPLLHTNFQCFPWEIHTMLKI